MHLLFSIIPTEAAGDPSGEGAAPPMRLAVVGTSCEPALYGEDLRAYAYEGDGSSAGSLASTISGEMSMPRLVFRYDAEQVDGGINSLVFVPRRRSLRLM